jgi:hypothetical protein
MLKKWRAIQPKPTTQSVHKSPALFIFFYLFSHPKNLWPTFFLNFQHEKAGEGWPQRVKGKA